MILEQADMEMVIQALCQLCQKQEFEKAVLEAEKLQLERELGPGREES